MGNLINILHLEDDPVDAELVQAVLQDADLNCDLRRAQNREEFEAALLAGGIDIILADFQLPMYDGLTALGRVLEVCPDIPFIFVSGTMGEEAAIEALTHGSTDYVLKNNLSRLPSAVLRAQHEAQDRRVRKQAEESIRKLSQAIEQSPVSIIITNLEGQIEFVNAEFSRVSGYASDEVINKNPRILKSGQTSPEEYKQLWETICSGGVWQGEFLNKNKNGGLFWEHATIAPIRDDNNAVTHFVAVKEDITERKRLEEQLHASQKLEAVGQLAGGVAHDFNNMLGVIIGYSEIILDNEDLDETVRNYLNQILAAGHRSSNITRQLLAFARKQTIVPTVLDLNETIEGMLKLLRRLIGENVDLVWQPDANLWSVKMDASQVDQILANLCVNAGDAITGLGRISIETKNVEYDDEYCALHKGFSPGEYVMLAVSDTGSGMSQSTIDKIFEPFFTTKPLGQGTGLGLATVYGIVKQNSGFIKVYSELEYGTTFKIFLPRTVVEAGQTPAESQGTPIPVGSETILLVEDDVLVLKLVMKMLENLGYRVLNPSTPGEAVRMANEHPGEIDLLLTDVVMPEITGRDLERELVSQNPDLKCLFMSGYSGSVIAHHGVLDESINFIQKPFTKKGLAEKVRQVLDS